MQPNRDDSFVVIWHSAKPSSVGAEASVP